MCYSWKSTMGMIWFCGNELYSDSLGTNAVCRPKPSWIFPFPFAVDFEWHKATFASFFLSFVIVFFLLFLLHKRFKNQMPLSLHAFPHITFFSSFFFFILCQPYPPHTIQEFQLKTIPHLHSSFSLSFSLYISHMSLSLIYFIPSFVEFYALSQSLVNLASIFSSQPFSVLATNKWNQCFYEFHFHKLLSIILKLK